jgi:hypothetical protein
MVAVPTGGPVGAALVDDGEGAGVGGVDLLVVAVEPLSAGRWDCGIPEVLLHPAPTSVRGSRTVTAVTEIRFVIIGA